MVWDVTVTRREQTTHQTVEEEELQEQKTRSGSTPVNQEQTDFLKTGKRIDPLGFSSPFSVWVSLCPCSFRFLFLTDRSGSRCALLLRVAPAQSSMFCAYWDAFLHATVEKRASSELRYASLQLKPTWPFPLTSVVKKTFPPRAHSIFFVFRTILIADIPLISMPG